MIVVGGRRYREEDAARLGLLGPGGVTPIEVKKPEGTADEAKTDDGEDAKRPAKSATKDEWVEHALAAGKTEEDLEGLTKDQIIELFPTD